MYRFFSIVIFVGAILFSFLSCSEERDGVDMYFIGDSIIKAWSTDSSFPDNPTHNWGVNGAGLDEFRNRSIDDSTAIVVCILGTNDLQYGLTEQQREAYADDYLSTISSWGGRHIYLFSVLPSSLNNRHEQIPYFNRLIKEKVRNFPQITYLDVYDFFLADDQQSIADGLTVDGLHLNASGYRYLTLQLKISMVQ